MSPSSPLHIATANFPTTAKTAAASEDIDMDCRLPRDPQLQQAIASKPLASLAMEHSHSTSSLDSYESSLADLSLASTMSDSSATSLCSQDDCYMVPAGHDHASLIRMMNQYSMSDFSKSNRSNNQHSPLAVAPSYFRNSQTGPFQQYPAAAAAAAAAASHPSSLGLDLGVHPAGEATLQQHRHSIAVSSANGTASGADPSSASNKVVTLHRASSESLPGPSGSAAHSSSSSSSSSNNNSRYTAAGLDMHSQTGLQANLSRFKISLPSISMPEDAFALRVATVPLTPGGSFFFGARDGAANGVPMSPFNPPTPLVQSGALTAAFEQQLAADGGILGSAYAAQHQYSPQLYSSSQVQQSINGRPTAQHQQHQQGQQTGPHRNRLQQKRASLPHILAPLSRSASGPMRSPLPRPQSRSGRGSASPRSSSPLSTSPSVLESSMGRVTVTSPSSSSQAFLLMQSRLAERYSPSRASMPPPMTSVSNSSASALTAPSLLTPPYSPMNVPGSAPAEITHFGLIPSSSSSTLHSVEAVALSRKSSAPLRQPNLEQAQSAALFFPSPSLASASNGHSPIPKPPTPVMLDAIPSPASLHLQLDVPTAEEIQAIKAQSARSAVSSAAMVKSASAPAAAAKTVSAQHLSNYNLHPDFAANYTLGDELGSGGFGFVVSAMRNRDNFPVAVKFIWKEKVPSQGWVRDRDLGVVPMEVFVLKTVRHPSVIHFIDLFDDDQFFYLVMELHGTPWKAPPPKSSSKKATAGEALKPSQQGNAQVGQAGDIADSVNGKALQPPRPAPMERRSSCDLFECIEQHSRLNEEQARWVFAQVVEAVYYLDSLGITHRDIKDENCVVDADFNVKLIDFGSAVVSDPRAPAPYFNRFYGTMTFASAEILRGQMYRAPQAEVWSLGVLLSILLSGECPFSDPSAAIKGRISKPKGMWTTESLELMMRCLDVDPNRRATVAELRDHPWVRRAWDRRGLKRPT